MRFAVEMIIKEGIDSALICGDVAEVRLFCISVLLLLIYFRWAGDMAYNCHKHTSN